MSVILRPDERPLFSNRPRSNLRIRHMALIGVLGWIAYMLLFQGGF